MLDVTQWFLESESPTVPCVRLDGSLSRDARERVLKGFRAAGGAKVLLASLKACGVGLNLTCASVVIMLDLWWNPAVEVRLPCLFWLRSFP